MRYKAVSFRALVGLLLAFVALSVADLYLTWKLIVHGSERFRESNPVAALLLAKYGWWGMTGFKVGGVALVGSLVLAISWRRPRTAEAVLVFGCGALSTVVMHSIFLGWSAAGQPERPLDAKDTARWANAPENETFVLLSQRAVQDELHLSESEVSDIGRLVLAHHEKTRDAAASGRDSWNAAVEEVLAERRAVIDQLGPSRVKRLQQISLQRRGADAFNDPDVKQRLELTAEQEEKIGTIVNAPAPPMPPDGFQRFRDHRPEGWRPPENPSGRVVNQILAVLTTEQLARWKDLIGEPFRGDPRPGFGVPRPGPWHDMRAPR
jgi:hypothetical protein